MTEREIAEELRRIEQMVARLSVCHRRPEKFHEDRSEAKAALDKLARKLEARK